MAPCICINSSLNRSKLYTSLAICTFDTLAIVMSMNHAKMELHIFVCWHCIAYCVSVHYIKCNVCITHIYDCRLLLPTQNLNLEMLWNLLKVSRTRLFFHFLKSNTVHNWWFLTVIHTYGASKTSKNHQIR